MSISRGLAEKTTVIGTTENYRATKMNTGGHSLEIQLLGLSAFPSGARVRSLVAELRSRKPQGVAKKKRMQEMNILVMAGQPSECI